MPALAERRRTPRRTERLTERERIRIQGIARREYEHAKSVLASIPEFSQAHGNEFWESSFRQTAEFQVGSAKIAVVHTSFQGVGHLELRKVNAVDGLIEHSEAYINTGRSRGGMPFKKKYSPSPTFSVDIDIRRGFLIGTFRVDGYRGRDSNIAGGVLRQFIDDLPLQDTRGAAPI